MTSVIVNNNVISRFFNGYSIRSNYDYSTSASVVNQYGYFSSLSSLPARARSLSSLQIYPSLAGSADGTTYVNVYRRNGNTMIKLANLCSFVSTGVAPVTIACNFELPFDKSELYLNFCSINYTVVPGFYCGSGVTANGHPGISFPPGTDLNISMFNAMYAMSTMDPVAPIGSILTPNTFTYQSPVYLLTLNG
jgi:hypothetical protein